MPSTECLKQTSTLQTFAFIMNWMKYHVVSSFVTYGSFFVSCQHKASKIKNTIVRNSFSAVHVVYTACNITHTNEKPIAALSVSSENFFPLVLHERAPLTVYVWDYTPFSPKRHFLQCSRPLQSQTTPCSVCKREKFDQFNISLNYIYNYPVSIRYC